MANRTYSREFRERAVELYRTGEVSKLALAKQLGVASSTVAIWIRQARIDDGKLTGIATADRDELTRLRREIHRLEMENEFLKRAAAYFAKEYVLSE